MKEIESELQWIQFFLSSFETTIFLPTLFVYIVLKSNLIESKNVGAEEESASIRIHYIPTLPRRFDFYEETATPLKRLKSFDIFVKEVCKERDVMKWV